MPAWLKESMSLGDSLAKVYKAGRVYNVTLDYHMVTKELESFMLHLSSVTLLGRSSLPAKDDFGDKICSYALKFVMGDVYFLLAMLLCAEVEERGAGIVKATCICCACKLVRRLRGDYIFMGPSPLILHADNGNA